MLNLAKTGTPFVQSIVHRFGHLHNFRLGAAHNFRRCTPRNARRLPSRDGHHGHGIFLRPARPCTRRAFADRQLFPSSFNRSLASLLYSCGGSDHCRQLVVASIFASQASRRRLLQVSLAAWNVLVLQDGRLRRFLPMLWVVVAAA